MMNRTVLNSGLSHISVNKSGLKQCRIKGEQVRKMGGKFSEFYTFEFYLQWNSTLK